MRQIVQQRVRRGNHVMHDDHHRRGCGPTSTINIVIERNVMCCRLRLAECRERCKPIAEVDGNAFTRGRGSAPDSVPGPDRVGWTVDSDASTGLRTALTE